MKLVERRRLAGIPELYALHLPSSLEWLSSTQSRWTKHTPERRLLEPLISNAGPAIGNHLESFVELMSDLCPKERDGEIRIRY